MTGIGPKRAYVRHPSLRWDDGVAWLKSGTHFSGPSKPTSAKASCLKGNLFQPHAKADKQARMSTRPAPAISRSLFVLPALLVPPFLYIVLAIARWLDREAA